MHIATEFISMDIISGLGRITKLKAVKCLPRLFFLDQVFYTTLFLKKYLFKCSVFLNTDIVELHPLTSI